MPDNATSLNEWCNALMKEQKMSPADIAALLHSAAIYWAQKALGDPAKGVTAGNNNRDFERLMTEGY